MTSAAVPLHSTVARAVLTNCCAGGTTSAHEDAALWLLYCSMYLFTITEI